MFWPQVTLLNIPTKEGPMVVVPHPFLTPSTLSHTFSIGADSKNLSLAEQLLLSLRMSCH